MNKSSASTSPKVYSVILPTVSLSSSSVSSLSSIVSSSSSKMSSKKSSIHPCPFNETPMEGISRCSYNFCDPSLCFHIVTPENLLDSCSDSCEEDHLHKHFCICEGASEDGNLSRKIAENSVEVKNKLVERVKDDNGDVTNMEENNDDNDEDLGEVLNTLRGLLDENLEKRLRTWDESLKTLGSEIAEASFKILQKRG